MRTKTMLKTYIFACALACVGLTSLPPAEASAEVYVKVEAGLTPETNVEHFQLGDDYTYGAAIGTGAGPFRIEAGVSRLSADIAGGLVEADAVDYSATAYLDFPVTANTGVFVGAGVDYVQAEATLGGFYSMQESGYGYHAAAGVATRVSERIILEGQVRYLEANVGDLDLSAPAFTLGARVRL
jgi:opacity protein-like surface antigen